MNRDYQIPLTASGYFGETETRTIRDYTELRKVGTNPDRFEELKKYNPIKLIKWTFVGLVGLTALVAGTVLTIKHFHKK